MGFFLFICFKNRMLFLDCMKSLKIWKSSQIGAIIILDLGVPELAYNRTGCNADKKESIFGYR